MSSNKRNGVNEALSVIKIIKLAQRKVRVLLMSGATINDILDELISILQEFYPEIKGSVLLLDSVEGTLHHCSAPGISKDYASLIDGLKIGLGQGSCGTAAFTKERVIVEDIANDPYWKNFQVALDFNLQACWSQPILSSMNDKVLGTFAMYYSNPKTPTEQEVELLEAVAELAGTVIEWKRVLNERQVLEEELKAANEELQSQLADLDHTAKKLEISEMRYRTVFEKSSDAILLVENGKYVDCNNAAVEMLAVKSKEDIISLTPFHIFPEYQPDGQLSAVKVIAAVRKADEEGLSRFEWLHKRMNGEEFWAEVLITPIVIDNRTVHYVVLRDISERKAAEEELLELNNELEKRVEERTARLSLLLESMPQIAWTAFPSGELDYVNNALLQYTGDTFDNLLNWGWFGYIHKEDKERTASLWKKAVNKGTDYLCEFRLRRRDGSYQWHIAKALPLKDQAENIIKWFGTTVDVHNYKEVEEALIDASIEREVLLEREKLAFAETEAQREILHKLFMEAPALICITNGPEHTFELVNPRFKEFRADRDLIGKKLLDAIPEIEGHPFVALLDKVYRTGETFTGKEFYGRFDRTGTGVLEDCYFDFIYQAKRNINGEVEGIVGFGFEVTEQVQARKVIEESARRSELLLETLPQIAWTADAEGNLSYYNQRWYDYTGLTYEDSIKWGWEKVVYPDDLQPTVKAWKHSLHTGEALELEVRFRNAEGTYKWHLTRALPIVNHAGQVVLWVGTCTYIHDHKSTLENLAEAQQQLQIINDELTAKNKELTKTNADLDNFIYTASHDLKAPIANVEGLIYALKRDIKTGRGQLEQILGMMDNSVNRFKNTIKDLTEISKIQKDLEEDREELSFRELLYEVELNIESLITDANAQIKADFSEVDALFFSRKNMRSILYNLVSNAIKYRSPERKAVVEIKTSRVDEHTIMLSVKDNGLGISLNQQAQVFSMFKRLHTHVEGSGIGLYIVKRIIENAGGSINVISELDKGTEFQLYINAQG
jgi:PAS domain S-box-containing protein